MKRIFLVTLLILLITALTLAEQNTHHATHDGHGFQNRYVSSGSRGSFLKWQLERLWYGLPKDSSRPIEPIPPDLDYLRHAGGQTSVTWIGHATVLLQVDGLNILTDPMFSDYASPFPPFGPKRHQPPGLS
ncbi:MAG: MBL fold metallo-hydrolase, partial [Betaproteobacteria bacterium]|nr:MBL fold metallo-hydrolase [Betaproteobacteria bacterium]